MHDKNKYYGYSDTCRVQNYRGYTNLCNEIVLTDRQKDELNAIRKAVEAYNSNGITKKPNRLLLIGRL